MLKLGEDISKDEIDRLVQSADLNEDGKIQFNEFVKACTSHEFIDPAKI